MYSLFNISAVSAKVSPCFISSMAPKRFLISFERMSLVTLREISTKKFYSASRLARRSHGRAADIEQR